MALPINNHYTSRVDLSGLIRADMRLRQGAEYLTKLALLVGYPLAIILASVGAWPGTISLTIVSVMLVTSYGVRRARIWAFWALLAVVAAIVVIVVVLWLRLNIRKDAMGEDAMGYLAFMLSSLFALPVYFSARAMRAVRYVHHLKFEGVSIDPVRCVQFRKRRRTRTRELGGMLRYYGLGAQVVFIRLFAILMVATIILIPLGIWYDRRRRTVVQRCRVARQAGAEELQRRDARDPVLLLRSFQDDTIALQASNFHRESRTKATTFEELLTEQLWARGPVIAIGQPGESVPPVGAARVYYANETWQAEAERMAREAQTIAMVIGTTEGLGWEFKRIADLKLLHKLILVFPPVTAEASEARWQRFIDRLDNEQRALLPIDVSPHRLMMIVYPRGNQPCAIEADGRGAQDYQIVLAAAQQMVEEAR